MFQHGKLNYLLGIFDSIHKSTFLITTTICVKKIKNSFLGKGASVEGSFTEMTFGKMKIPAEVLNSIPLSRDSSLAAANSNTPPTKQKTLTAQSSSMDKSDGEINCFVFFFYMMFFFCFAHICGKNCNSPWLLGESLQLHPS